MSPHCLQNQAPGLPPCQPPPSRSHPAPFQPKPNQPKPAQTKPNPKPPPPPGEDETEQLACIMEIMGAPPRALLDAASRRKAFFDSSYAPRLQPNSRGKLRSPGGKSLRGALRCDDAAFMDLLEQCLKWVAGLGFWLSSFTGLLVPVNC